MSLSTLPNYTTEKISVAQLLNMLGVRKGGLWLPTVLFEACNSNACRHLHNFTVMRLNWPEKHVIATWLFLLLIYMRLDAGKTVW